MYDLIKNVNTKTQGSVEMITFFIKEIRKQKGITQKQLAKISGVSASEIGYIENNERQPTLLTMCRLAKALKVSVLDLFEYHE
jgi:transcriptional regulator with XRE-family HTH domain